MNASDDERLGQQTHLGVDEAQHRSNREAVERFGQRVLHKAGLVDHGEGDLRSVVALDVERWCGRRSAQPKPRPACEGRRESPQ